MSAHVTVVPDCDCHDVALNLKSLLHDEFDLDHTTLQVDHEGNELLLIEPIEQQTSPVTSPGLQA